LSVHRIEHAMSPHGDGLMDYSSSHSPTVNNGTMSRPTNGTDSAPNGTAPTPLAPGGGSPNIMYPPASGAPPGRPQQFPSTDYPEGHPDAFLYARPPLHPNGEGNK